MTQTQATDSSFCTKTSGAKLHYTSAGDRQGPLLLLLHGLGGSSKTFDALVPHLPQKYHILSIDLEGFGESTLTDAKISVQRHVANLDDLISSLQKPAPSQPNAAAPVVIVGHSLGSIVALHYTATKPTQVAGLGLLGIGRSAAHIEAVRDRMTGMASRARTEGMAPLADLAVKSNLPDDATTEQKQEVRSAVASSDPEAYAQTCEAMVCSEHKDPDYAAIKCPAVFVTGDKDMISPPARAQEVSTLLGGESSVYLVRGGHQPIISDIDGTIQALDKLFSSIT